MPLELFPYQAEAAAWLATRERAGLFDEMGIGKTATCIRAHDLRRSKRGITVCPAFLRENWRAEYTKFAHVERRIVKARSIHDLIAWQRERFDVILMSFEQAAKWAPRMLDNLDIVDFCDVDEAHYAKNPFSQRTQALLGANCDGKGGIAMLAAQLFWVTGTLMANDPIDAYSFLRMVGAVQMTQGQFAERFFESRSTAYATRNTPLVDMVGPLQEMIRNNGIRRTHGDVGLQLPEIFLTTTMVDGDTSEIAAMLRQHPDLELAILEALDAGGLSKIQADYVATLRRLIGQAKAIPYAEMLTDEIQQVDRKRVVFGVHRAALTSIRDHLAGKGISAVLVNGDTVERERVGAVKAFQEDDRCRVFLGNMRAAGVGITLTAAAQVDIFESAWDPASNAQAIKRVHRIGQRAGAVHGRFITLARSFDEAVNDIVIGKTKAIAMVEGSEMLSVTG